MLEIKIVLKQEGDAWVVTGDDLDRLFPGEYFEGDTPGEVLGELGIALDDELEDAEDI